MNFNERVLLTTMGAAPEGWADKVNLEEYVALDDERKKYYEPLYAKYRTKKVRDYDPDYGNFLGWKPIQVGIGEPIGYKYIGYFGARVLDQAMDSNVSMSRVLNKPKKWNGQLTNPTEEA